MITTKCPPPFERRWASTSRRDIRSQAKPYAVSDFHSIRIFLPDGKFFGQVKDDTLYKNVKGKKHILQILRAIAFDVAAFELARQHGACKVSITDTVSGKVYNTLCSTIDSIGFNVKDYGYGKQRALNFRQNTEICA